MASKSSWATASWSPALDGRPCGACYHDGKKCFFDDPDSRCNRCHRLDMVCEPSTGAHKRRRREPSFDARMETSMGDKVNRLQENEALWRNRGSQVFAPFQQVDLRSSATPRSDTASSTILTPKTESAILSIHASPRSDVVSFTMLPNSRSVASPQSSISPLTLDANSGDVATLLSRATSFIKDETPHSEATPSSFHATPRSEIISFPMIPNPEPESESADPWTPITESDGPWTPILSDHAEGALDTDNDTVTLPPGTDETTSLLFQDVSGYGISEKLSKECLNTFRVSFLPIFPVIHLNSRTAPELQQEKPFTWQYALGDTIWQIISERVVCQHHANLDLLIGLITFGPWSHRFYKDKPFMTMISQLAVSVAADLGLDKSSNKPGSKFGNFGSTVTHVQPPIPKRTSEERRAMLALYHLTASTWMAYRKGNLPRWTEYMNKCLRKFLDRPECPLDFVLAAQIKCQLVALEIDMLSVGHSTMDDVPTAPSKELAKSLSDSLDGVIQKIPKTLAEKKLIVIKSRIGRRSDQDKDPYNFKRLQALDQALSTVERWFTLWLDIPSRELFGINVDMCTQLLRSLVILFRLNTHVEEGWDRRAVRGRVNVLSIVDRCSVMIRQLPIIMGIIAPKEPPWGFFSFTPSLFRAIKGLFTAEIRSQNPGNIKDGGKAMTEKDYLFSEQFLAPFCEQPWFADMVGAPWFGRHTHNAKKKTMI
ncbi:hypothetical protein FSARC_7349 [Fusarium sarcochroum]|uniref:Zn(2)-C6 fungal-type domain-containing protein n=1 Tax=Fusarium sarcochroum TaxID=1208366 RepID=A0A8H4TVJ1_9HYPO|nr:hypothetical protein FSARC_7349 [Fusarium sarcochroum]